MLTSINTAVVPSPARMSVNREKARSSGDFSVRGVSRAWGPSIAYLLGPLTR